jgi:RNA-binding protein
MPSSPLRRALRAAGHHLHAIVQVGKEGVTEPVVRQLDEALDHHELVKVKVGTESPEDRFEVAQALAAHPETQIAQVLGRTVLVYRRHPEHPRFEAGPPRGAAADDGTQRSAPKRPRAKRPAWKPAASGAAKRGPAAAKRTAAGASRGGTAKPRGGGAAAGAARGVAKGARRGGRAGPRRG